MNNNTITTIALAVFGLTMASTAVEAADINVIYAGTLLTTPGESPLTQQTVVIKDGVITSITSGYQSAPVVDEHDNIEIIDLKNSFVMPGLMDMHGHLQGELGPNNDSEVVRM